MTPSKQQEAIYADIAMGEGHTVVVARAGCGKTTTIVESLAKVPSHVRNDVLLVAFNKSIAAALQDRAPRGVEVSTLHSYGLRQISRAVHPRPQIDADKMRKILRGLSKSAEMRVVVAKITSLAKGMLVSSETDLDALIDSNGIALPGLGELTESDERRVRSKAIALSLEALRLSREDQTTIDFDDMIWFPNIFDVRCTKYARIFVDETQDLNAAQVKLALKACELGGRICAVGDPAQAIYGFRGADSMAIKKLTAKLNAKTLPLSITYRCARAIVALAREYVPDFEAAPDAPTGSVTETTDAIMLRDVAPGDFILSRTNAPLVTYAFALYRQGRPAHIQGRDLSTHLKAIIARAKTENVADFLAKTETWRAKEVKRLLDLDRDTSMTEDTAECLVALAEDCTSVSEIGEKVDTLFADLTGDGHDRIVLSSTHKAKGLERDRVWLLRDTFMRRPGDEEKNLFYVAVTRAKNDLRLVRTTKA